MDNLTSHTNPQTVVITLANNQTIQYSNVTNIAVNEGVLFLRHHSNNLVIYPLHSFLKLETK